MKRFLPLFAIFFLAGLANPLVAQETVENELELVRKLREKGWNDLAKIKIEELLKRGDPALNAALPLELARINIGLARNLRPDQRGALFTDARKQLQFFINNNPGKPEAALASAEMARVTTYHAQAILSSAMREEDNKTRHEKARPAETMFIEASKDLETAIKRIDEALPKATGGVKSLLEQEKKQARFDIAINIFDQAKTFIDRGKEKVNQDRSVTMGKAIEAFKVLRSDESSELGWLANAWLVKLHIEITDPDNALKYYKSIMDRKGDKTAQPAIQPAIRLVRYFAIQDMTLPRADEPETIGNFSLVGKTKIKKSQLDRLKDVQKEGEAWVTTYGSYLKTYEGQGILYELGHAYLTEAYMDQDKKDAKGAKKNFDSAKEKFELVGKTESDLGERSRQFAMSIEFKNVAEGKSELKNFDQFYLKAMIERQAVIKLSQSMDDPKLADKKVLEADRAKHLKEVITSLNKALALADTKTPIQKMDDARYYLTGAYLASGDPYRAAIVAEALGRARSTGRSPEGAATALQTYSALQARHPDDASIKVRLNDLAAFVLSPQSQETWKGAQVTSFAHYHLGMAAYKEGDTKRAIGHLDKLATDFTDYIYTQGQLVFFCQAAREKTDDKKEQKFYIDAARAALKRMPMYGKDANPSVITMYYFAKLEDSKFMYAEAVEDMNKPAGELKAIQKLNEMSKYVRDLQNSIGALPGKTITHENREQIEFTMQVMLKYADLGLAETKFRGDKTDRFDEVIKATKSVVDDAVGKAKATKGDLAMKDYRVTGDILSLALRANVQKGNIEQGKAILDVLNRLRGPDANQKPGNVVAVLLNDIAGQIKTMKKEADARTFQKTRESYNSFLDVIAKEYEVKGDDLNASIMLAHAYLSLDYPAKAVAHFAKVKAPPGIDKELPKKNPKMNEKQLEALAQQEEAVGRYWGVQVEYIRALRATKDKDSLVTAEKTAKALIDNKHAKFHLHAMMERNLIIEDLQRYREAYLAWQGFLKNPSISGGNLGKPEVQKIYFPAYFHTARTLYKTATLDPAIKDRQKLIDGAASMIFKLETAKTKEGWEISGPLFQELLKDKEYDQLKKAYDKLKQALPKGNLLERERPALALDCSGTQHVNRERSGRLFWSTEGAQKCQPRASAAPPWLIDSTPFEPCKGETASGDGTPSQRLAFRTMVPLGGAVFALG